MKIGLKTNCYNNKSWEETLDILKEQNIKAVEPAAGGFNGKAHCDAKKLLEDKEAMRAYKKAADDRGIEISAFAVHGNPLHPNKQFADEHAADLENCINLAGALGVKCVTCFTGCPGANEKSLEPNWITCPFPPYFGEAVLWQWEKRVLPFWSKMAEKAKKAGVYCAIEMHPGDVTYNPELLLRLREKVGMEEIACNFDPSHLFWQGIDPIQSIRRLKDMIVHVHAKDCKVDEINTSFRGCLDWKDYGQTAERAWNFRTCGYGHGVEFWNDFVSNLREVGYDWVLSIEHEDPLMSVQEGIDKTIEFLNLIMFHEEVGARRWWEM